MDFIYLKKRLFKVLKFLNYNKKRAYLFFILLAFFGANGFASKEDRDPDSYNAKGGTGSGFGRYQSVSSFGGVPNSYFFWQARAGENVLEGGMDYSSRTIEFSSTLGSTKNSLSGIENIKFGFERGLTEMFSVGVNWAYANMTAERVQGSSITNLTTNSSLSGMRDLVIYGKGQGVLQSQMSYHYGSQFSMSIGNRTKDETGSEWQNDAKSGGYTLRILGGIQFQLPQMIVGGQGAFDVFASDKTIESKSSFSTTTSSYSGGKELIFSGFGEYAGFKMSSLPLSVLGVVCEYHNIDPITTNGGTESEGLRNFVRFKTYPVFQLNSKILLMGDFYYDYYTDASTSSSNLTLSSGSEWSFGALIKYKL